MRDLNVIVNASQVSARLFALGLDTKEIADALALDGAVVFDALRQSRAPDATPRELPRSEVN